MWNYEIRPPFYSTYHFFVVLHLERTWSAKQQHDSKILQKATQYQSPDQV